MPQIAAFVAHCDNFETCGTPDVTQVSSSLPPGWANITASVLAPQGSPLEQTFTQSMLLCNVDVQKMAVLLSTAFAPVWNAIGNQPPPPPPIP